MRRGFTLIEVLVASLLLGILISMLSTLFSQSSIAWSAGTAMVVDLDSSRREIARYQVDADVTLDSKGTVVQSVFSGMKGTDLNSRAAKASSASKVKGIFNSPSSWSGIGVGGARDEGNRPGTGRGMSYIVGVTSYGPDGKPETWDDITTWPAEEE